MLSSSSFFGFLPSFDVSQILANLGSDSVLLECTGLTRKGLGKKIILPDAYVRVARIMPVIVESFS